MFSVTSGSPHSQEGNLDTEAGPEIAEFDGGEHFVVRIIVWKCCFVPRLNCVVCLQDSEFRPAHEVFSGGGGGQLDLDYLQQHGSESSSVSHLAR